MDGPTPSAGPRNIQFMLNRLSAYSKNTIQLQPQTKSVYMPSDTIAFRLPASALLDLHTFTLQFRMNWTDGRNQEVGADAGIAAPPRFLNGLFKRVDVQLGGTSVGLTGLHDYGALYTLLGHHTIHQDRAGMDLKWTEACGMIPYNPTGNQYPGEAAAGQIVNTQAATSRYRLGVGSTRSDWYQARSFLGLLGGGYMRFLDTNILPEATVYFQLAPKHVVCATNVTTLNWNIDRVTLNMESVNFGDGTYRALIDRRLAVSDIVIPFSNWTGFEGQQTNAGSSITQFTVASKSLNGLIGTLRRGDYDAQPTTMVGNGSYNTDNTMIKLAPKQVTSPGSKYYQFFCGRDPVGLDMAPVDQQNQLGNQFWYGYPLPLPFARYADDTSAAVDVIDVPNDEIYDMYSWPGLAGNIPAFQTYIAPNPQAQPAVPGRPINYPVPNYWLSNRKKSTAENSLVPNSVYGSPRYQFTVDSKLYPQFNADVIDAAQLTKNYFDAGAMNMSFGGTVGSLKEYLNHAFIFPIGLDHHSDSAKSDNLVSGIDTRNSQIPISFTIQNLPTVETVRPTIFANMTSMLVVGPDRIISTVL